MVSYSLEMKKKCIISPNTAGRLIRRHHDGRFSPDCKEMFAKILEDFTAEVVFRARKHMQAKKKKNLTVEFLRMALR